MIFNNFFLVVILAVTGLGTSLNIFSLTRSPAANEQLLLWLGGNNAESYTLRIYRSDNNSLFKEFTGLRQTIRNVTGLESGTRYSATVTAFSRNNAGSLVESSPSARFEFRTKTECKNGKVFDSCSAHCVATCQDPFPICSRICTSGCSCPAEKPIWQDGKCITLPECPPVIAIVPKPHNARVINEDKNSVHFTWDPVEDAELYKVQVKESTSGRIQQTMTSPAPIMTVSDLVPGVTYKLVVTPVPMELRSSSTIQPPNGVSVSHITEDSFRVSWNSQDSATSYGFLLFAENGNMLMSVKRIQQTSVVVQGLNAGTVYRFSVASRSPTEYGEFTQPQAVSTVGELSDFEECNAAFTTVTIAATATATPSNQPQANCRSSKVRTRSSSSLPVNFLRCDADGNFETTQCVSNNCWCVDKYSGEKLIGSDMDLLVSDLILECNNFGTLDVFPLKLEARNLSSTSLKIRWNNVNNFVAYVIIIDDNVETPYVEHVRDVSRNFYKLRNLRSGYNYKIGVYGVDSDGASGPVSYIQARTALLDKPENVVLRKETSGSISLNWRHSAKADGFEVQLILPGIHLVLHTYKVVENTITIENLSPARYIVEIRAITCDSRCTDENTLVVARSEPATVDFNLQCSLPIMDILFAFDTTSNANLERQKQIAEAIITPLLPLNELTGTRIGAMAYNQQPKSVFSYNKFLEHKSNGIFEDLKQLRSTSEETSRIRFMLLLTRVRFFNDKNIENYSRRSNANSVFIIMSGSSSTNDRFNVAEALPKLHESSTIIVVKMNEAASSDFLEQLPSEPNLLINASNQNNNESIANDIREKLCSLDRN